MVSLLSLVLGIVRIRINSQREEGKLVQTLIGLICLKVRDSLKIFAIIRAVLWLLSFVLDLLDSNVIAQFYK